MEVKEEDVKYLWEETEKALLGEGRKPGRERRYGEDNGEGTTCEQNITHNGETAE